MERDGKLELWDDDDITAGGKACQEDILKEVADSDILLYLVSADSLASENCNKELTEAVRAEKRVIPIILESCDWLNDRLSDFEVLPDKGKPINRWQPHSDGWQNVVDGIRRTIEEMQTQAAPPSRATEEGMRAKSALQQGNVLMMIGQIDRAIEAYSRAIELNHDYAAAYNNRGVAHGAKGDSDRAFVDFDKAIRLNPNYADVYNNRGVVHEAKGDSDHAIADYTKAIALKRNYAEAYNNRGNIYSKKGEPDRATADYAKAINLKPDYADAYHNRGNAYSNGDDWDRAILDFTKAIALNPNDAEAYNRRGIAYGKKGDSDRAIVDFNKAIALNPNDAAAYNNRGIAYGKKGDSDRAIADYTKAIALKSDYADAYHNRGNAYNDAHDWDRAIADFTKTIHLNPNDAEAYHNRGAAYGNKGDVDRTIEDSNRAIELKPDFAAAYNNRGVAYRKKGDVDRTIQDLNKAIDLNPEYADAYNNRGIAYGMKGDHARAIADLDKAINLNPDYTEAYINRGVAYNGRGNFDFAMKDFNKAMTLNPDCADAYHSRGVVCAVMGNYDLAIADLDKAIQLNPNYAEAYSNRGLAYKRMGNFDFAMKDFNKAMTLNPNYADAYHGRGIVYGVKGDYDRAIIDFNKAIDLKPDFADAYINRGQIRLRLEEWDNFKSELVTARNMGVDIIKGFKDAFTSVGNFERITGIKLPEDIAIMLTQRRRSRFPSTQEFLKLDGTPFESPEVLNLLEKLRNAATPLSQYIQTRPTFGLKTGSSGAFVVDSATRDRLIAEHPTSADILKPFLHGRNIRRWQVARPDSWLIFTCRRIEINRYPAIRKHLEKYRSSLSKRAGKQKWYELPVTKRDAEHFTKTKLVCPNTYDHQTFAVDTDGFYCGDTCYVIPTEETWLCGLLNSRVVEWFYSQESKQLTGDYLKARSRYMKEIPIPDLTTTQKSQIGKIVDYLIYLQGQPTTRGVDLAHARDFIMFKYFERIIDGLVYESYLGEELHQGGKHFFKPLLDEGLLQIEEMRGDKMSALREIFERLYEKTHPVRINLFFLDSVKPIRIIEGKA